RTCLADLDLEPAIRPLGRRLRRPGRRRRHDRPHRAPRRSTDPQRLKLPTQRHRNRHTALRTRRQHGTITTPPWPTFRPSPLAYLWTGVNTVAERNAQNFLVDMVISVRRSWKGSRETYGHDGQIGR